MKKKLILTIVLAFICVCSVVTSIVLPTFAMVSVPTEEISSEIKLIKSDFKFTQEQMLSRIKAEYLKENNGYQDDDEITVIVSLAGDSVIDAYQKANTPAVSVAEYLQTSEGKQVANQIANDQSVVVANLQQQNLISGVVCYYSTIMNAVAVKTTYGKMAQLGKANAVANVMMSETFNLPQSAKTQSSGATVVNEVDIYPTGIYNSASVNFTGKGTAVAVLDSGFDLSHEVFQRELNADEVLYSREDIGAKLEQTNAYKLTSGLQLYNVYATAKVPFVYDYADKDYDVFPYDSEHGTHVAGIIGGKSDTITGIAVDTQLVLMKVFPDLDEGGKTEDILLALEDCVTLGVDVINMSLGSSCGFSRVEDDENLNKVYKAIGDAGISLITAASNDYSSAFGGDQGNTNKATNPDSGTVGSPSTYASALSVASISGTKSRYVIANGNQVFFYKESNSISGTENDFYGELYQSLLANGYTEEQLKQSITLPYVTVPGVGISVNFTGLDLHGKVAVIRRGDNTFEEKAANAKKAGAIACIIYNNIDGDILMSMGKSDHIPTVSISKDDGYKLAQKDNGTMEFNFNDSEHGGYLAGPFISDFSSWGPTPSLEMKPEITAHGGNILSAVPNGGYDELSGTSMATPNLAGIVVLIRQYLKEKYPTYSWNDINNMANQLLMSTATICLNEEGNPYSPRKQGAGLASLYNVVNTKAFLSVDGSDRTKLELGDDPTRSGVYTMQFNIVNISDSRLTYDLSLVGMTETVSSSDESFVAETPQILGDNYTFEFVGGDGSVNGKTVSVDANGTVKLKVTYTLTDEDKHNIESLFPYGMYVEGFVKLASNSEINLNIPFLAFYGDWTEAPMFDKTYYEVESEAHNKAIDDEDKIKADYIATTPYGSYYYNYIIPLGTYLYDIDENLYDAIPASTDHIAVSNTLGCIDGIGAVYTGLLRSAKQMDFTITDKATGEVVYTYTEYNATKAHYYSMAYPYYADVKFKSYPNNLVNNREYEFNMVGKLDYGDGGETTNVRNSFGFTFTMDDEAPIIKSAVYSKTYDKTLKKDRYYVTLTLYDNQYVQSVTPIIFTSSSSYTYLTDNPIPVYSEKGKDSTIKLEITDYLEDIYDDQIITSALAFAVDDYALNSNLFLCQLPGTNGSFKFTTNGEEEGSDLIILSMYEDDVVDLRNFLSTTDKHTDEAKDYLKHLVWNSSNQKVVEVNEGLVVGVKAGKATVSVREQMDLRQAVLIINVKEKQENPADRTISTPTVDNVENAKIESVRFSHYDTVFAYSRAAQTSEIGQTGDRNFTSAKGSVSFYPGEKIKLALDINPWYVASKYEYVYESTNPAVASVDQNGVVTGLKEGNAIISVKISGSNLRAILNVTIKNEFVIENRMLVAYKGLGGNVVIPDDEGILYIGAYAFCLYNTDNSIELTEEDYDANKIPDSNTTITSVVIPEGVEDIQKYAFYNCTGLRSVVIPSTVKFIREYAFYGDTDLERVVTSDAVVREGDSQASSYPDAKVNKTYLNVNGDLVAKTDKTYFSLANAPKLEVLGAYAFYNCEKLDNVDVSNIYAIGRGTFAGCKSLSYVDLTCLRNTGAQTFQGCENLKSVTLVANTKLSYAMFARSGLTSVDIYNADCDIPTFCFAQCKQLKTVTLHGDIVEICEGAFSECEELTSVTLNGHVDVIGSQAFYGDSKLGKFTLPDNDVKIGNHAFYQCSDLQRIYLQKNTRLLTDDTVITSGVADKTQNVTPTNLNGYMFAGTKVNLFVVDENNPYYKCDIDGRLLLSKDGKTVIMSVQGKNDGEYVLDDSYTHVADGAFAGVNFSKIIITNPNLVVGAYAFADCKELAEVVLPAESGITLGNYAFANATALTTVTNMASAKVVGNYAFLGTALTSAEIGANAVVGEGAFLRVALITVTVGENAEFGLGAFQDCKKLTTVNMPENGGVHFGQGCFANDSALSTLDFTKIGERIEAETFYGCSALVNADMAHVTHIGNYAFADCATLSNIKVPSVVEIGEGAFSRYDSYGGAPRIVGIELPDSLIKIGDGAFLGCEQLLTVTIPSSVTDFGNYIFAYCKALGSVNLPDSITTIGKYTFAGCEELEVVNTAKVEIFGDYAFTSCYVLANIDLSSAKEIGFGAFAGTMVSGKLTANNLVKIGDYAFQNANLLGLTADKLESVGECAFQGNKELAKFVFNGNLAHVGTMAFQGCEKLTSFYCNYGGLDIADCTINDYAKLVDGVLYTKLANGKWELKSVPAGNTNPILTVADGTYRIDTYAGNDNKNITVIILPDSLSYIGNYAFNGCENLVTVEFRSVQAPVLEDFYDSDTVLAENAPGFELLHNQFDLFGLELYYYTFIDLVGSKEPIKMIVPCNKNISGYDSAVYLAYFGKVGDSETSSYVAMEKAMVDFVTYANKIATLKAVNISHEDLVNKALASYNNVTQDPTTYGIMPGDWYKMVETVMNAKQKLTSVKLKTVSKEAQQVIALLQNLPTQFNISMLTQLADISARINALDVEERTLLDLTSYNALLDSYKNYCNALQQETTEYKNISTFGNVQAVTSVLSLTLMAFVVLGKKLWL